MDIIKPKKLQPGDTIGIIAPGANVSKEDLEKAAENLRGFGYRIVLHPQVFEKDRIFSGTRQQRLDGLHDMFRNPEIDAVFAATGGLRTVQLLDGIDYDLIRENPKIICGFSDVTYLLQALHKRSGLVGFHGLNLRGYLLDDPMMDDKAETLSFLSGNYSGDLMKQKSVQVIASGKASGRLMGGNLSLLLSLMAMGDAYMAPFKNALLMIEDIGEEIRQIDRMLSTMRLAGVFDQISGLMIGQVTDVGDTGTHYRFNCDVKEIILEHLSGSDFPVIYRAPFGHERPNYPLPIGVKATLDASGTTPVLSLDESPFADA